MTPQQRSGIQNGIWMCANHGVEVDTDKAAYPVELLKTWKAEAEDEARIAKGRPQRDQRAGASRVAVSTVISRLRLRFRRSLEPHLAGGSLIPRPETQDVISAVDDGTSRLIVVHGVAGVGKSGILLELVTHLELHRIPYLPLRLDCQTPAGSPEAFGAALDLPDSPAFVLERLAEDRPSVLILDQMDALRWTRAHAADPWSAFQELVDDALSLSPRLRVVVCCRTFDLEHDPQIRAWEDSQQKLLRRVRVEDFSETALETAVTAIAGAEALRDLRPRERKLLRHVFHLAMWSEIRRSRGPSPAFETARDLIDRFWATRYDDLAQRGIDRGRAEKVLDDLIEAMCEGAILSIPRRALDASQVEREALTSLHILQIVDDGKRGGWVSFCHQSHLDHLVARRLLRALGKDGSRDLLMWLGPRGRQSLFRREQLRLVLGGLREELPTRYGEGLRQLLTAGDGLRFHLRLVVLEFLGQIPEPRPEEIELVLELLDNAFWRPHVLTSLAARSVPWLEILDDHRVVAQWLASNEPPLQDAALTLLRWASEDAGDRVAALLGPLAALDETWSRRCASVLANRPETDSDKLFALRVALVLRGTAAADHVDWKSLAAADFYRFAALAASRLVAVAHQLSSRGHSAGSMENLYWSGLETITDFTAIPSEQLQSGWELILAATDLFLLASGGSHREALDALEPLVAPVEGYRDVLILLKAISAELLRRDWRKAMVHLAERLTQRQLSEVLLLDAAPAAVSVPGFADATLAWLMAKPSRLRLRYRPADSPWSLSAAAVETASRHCSGTCFLSFELFLLDFREPDHLERYRQHHAWLLREGPSVLGSPSYAGATCYHLLPRLPVERRSVATARRILELDRKFAEWEKKSPDFFGGYPVGRAGSVGSPLDRDRRAPQLTDRAWLGIMQSSRVQRRDSDRRWRFRDGRFEESTHEMFARSLSWATEREPERFARLACSIPAGVPTEYLEQIVAGLVGEKPADHIPQEQRAKWLPASHEAMEAVLALPAVRERAMLSESQLGWNICRLLSQHAQRRWSAPTLKLLSTMATDHADPVPGHPGVTSNAWRPESPDGLMNNAINCVRGKAGFAIARVLFSYPASLPLLIGAVENLVLDPQPAVRVGGIEACLPILNDDRETAIRLFLIATREDETLLATSPARALLRYTVLNETAALEPTLIRMISSESEEVARVGAGHVTACYLLRDRLPELYARCLEGGAPLRRGIVDTALSLLGDSAWSATAKRVLVALLDDDEVGNLIGVVGHPRRMTAEYGLRLDDPFLVAFARSRAFGRQPYLFLKTLEEQPGSLLPYAEVIVTAVRTFAELFATKSRDAASSHTSEARLLPPLLLRLYGESLARAPAVYQECLDLWDVLLERRVGYVQELTRRLDEF